MPIYEYRCDNCAHEFETIQKVSEAPLTTCPACARETLRKKVSAAGFRLKGGGWYETDFKAGNKKNVAGEDKAAKDADKSAGDKSAGDKSAGDKSTDKGGGTRSDRSGTKGAADGGGKTGSTGGSTGSGTSKAKASE